jgi:hypothetical protein
LQHDTNILVETPEATSTSVDQDDEENGSKDKINSSADHKGESKALEADFGSGANNKNSQETKNKGEGEISFEEPFHPNNIHQVG